MIRKKSQDASKRHVKIIAKLAKRSQEQSQEQENDGSSFYIPQAEKIVNEILKLCCLNESQGRKLLDLKHLNSSADGSKLKAHSNS
jgi:Mor family transcriptional regulator